MAAITSRLQLTAFWGSKKESNNKPAVPSPAGKKNSFPSTSSAPGSLPERDAAEVVDITSRKVQEIIKTEHQLSEFTLEEGDLVVKYWSNNQTSVVDRLCLLISSEPGTPAGLWSRSLCLRRGAEGGGVRHGGLGSMLPFLDACHDSGMGVVIVSDPFGKETASNNARSRILLLWQKIVAQSRATHVFIVAYMEAGAVVVELIRDNLELMQRQLSGVALIESTHNLKDDQSYGFLKFMSQWVFSFVHSDLPRGARVREKEAAAKCVVISSGTMYVGSQTLVSSVPSIFAAFKARWSGFRSQAPTGGLTNTMTSIGAGLTGYGTESSATECYTCKEKFSLTRWRFYCRTCQWAVCKGCSVLERVQPIGEVRLCRTCSSIPSLMHWSRPRAWRAGEQRSLYGDHPEHKLSVDDFELIEVIGKGACGKVVLVIKKDGKDQGKLFAMKVLKKKWVMNKDLVAATMAERMILQEAEHPFIVQLRYAFQSHNKLYMVMDFYHGGSLREILRARGCFSVTRSKFYLAELILAIGHLHSRDIVWRDIKTENILIDMEGHIAATDFGLSKPGMTEGEKASSFVGTGEYLAPELLHQAGYGKPVDWWGLGILAFEFITGRPPFTHVSLPLLFERIKNEEPVFTSQFTVELEDLIKKLLSKDPTRRGPGGVEEIKTHPFFADVDWEALYQKKAPVPPLPFTEEQISEELRIKKSLEKIRNTREEAMCETPVTKEEIPMDIGDDVFDRFTYVHLEEDVGGSGRMMKMLVPSPQRLESIPDSPSTPPPPDTPPSRKLSAIPGSPATPPDSREPSVLEEPTPIMSTPASGPMMNTPAGGIGLEAMAAAGTGPFAARARPGPTPVSGSNGTPRSTGSSAFSKPGASKGKYSSYLGDVKEDPSKKEDGKSSAAGGSGAFGRSQPPRSGPDAPQTQSPIIKRLMSTIETSRSSPQTPTPPTRRPGPTIESPHPANAAAERFGAGSGKEGVAASQVPRVSGGNPNVASVSKPSETEESSSVKAVESSYWPAATSSTSSRFDGPPALYRMAYGASKEGSARFPDSRKESLKTTQPAPRLDTSSTSDIRSIGAAEGNSSQGRGFRTESTNATDGRVKHDGRGRDSPSSFTSGRRQLSMEPAVSKEEATGQSADPLEGLLSGVFSKEKGSGSEHRRKLKSAENIKGPSVGPTSPITSSTSASAQPSNSSPGSSSGSPSRQYQQQGSLPYTNKVPGDSNEDWKPVPSAGRTVSAPAGGNRLARKISYVIDSDEDEETDNTQSVSAGTISSPRDNAARAQTSSPPPGLPRSPTAKSSQVDIRNELARAAGSSVVGGATGSSYGAPNRGSPKNSPRSGGAGYRADDSQLRSGEADRRASPRSQGQAEGYRGRPGQAPYIRSQGDGRREELEIEERKGSRRSPRTDSASGTPKSSPRAVNKPSLNLKELGTEASVEEELSPMSRIIKERTQAARGLKSSPERPKSQSSQEGRDPLPRSLSGAGSNRKLEESSRPANVGVGQVSEARQGEMSVGPEVRRPSPPASAPASSSSSSSSGRGGPPASLSKASSQQYRGQGSVREGLVRSQSNRTYGPTSSSSSSSSSLNQAATSTSRPARNQADVSRRYAPGSTTSSNSSNASNRTPVEEESPMSRLIRERKAANAAAAAANRGQAGSGPSWAYARGANPRTDNIPTDLMNRIRQTAAANNGNDQRQGRGQPMQRRPTPMMPSQYNGRFNGGPVPVNRSDKDFEIESDSERDSEATSQLNHSVRDSEWNAVVDL